MLRSPRKPTRKISKIPFKVLDAPELQDDFYLNLVDWSSLNVLSVGLGTCVYLWSACTSQVGAAGPVGAHTRVCHGAEGRLLPAAEPSQAQPSPRGTGVWPGAPEPRAALPSACRLGPRVSHQVEWRPQCPARCGLAPVTTQSLVQAWV